MAVGASRTVNPFDRGKRTSNGVNERTATFTTSSSQEQLLSQQPLFPMDESWLGMSTSCTPPEYVPMIPPPVPCRRHEAFELSDIEYGVISRDVAEALCTRPGEYLVRRGTTQQVDYKLTIRRHMGHSHYNIYKDRHPYSSAHCIYFLDDTTRKLLFVNMTDLITHIIRNPSSYVCFEHGEVTLQPCSKLIKRVLDPMLLRKGRSINLNITSSRKYFTGKYGTEKVVLMEKDDYLRVLAELSIRAQFRNHPNILQYLGVTVLQPIYMVFPLEAQLCLHKHIKQLRSSKTKRMISICHDVCCALIYMHSNNYIHRSLQTRACVIDRRGVTKILDLGKSCHMDQDSLTPSDGEVILVPTRWAAPEVLRYSIFSKASDVWSFGVFVWEVFNKGKTPYYDIINEEALLSMLKPGFRLSLKKKHSQYDILLEKCLKYNANNRPSLDILERTIQALILS